MNKDYNIPINPDNPEKSTRCKRKWNSKMEHIGEERERESQYSGEKKKNKTARNFLEKVIQRNRIYLFTKVLLCRQARNHERNMEQIFCTWDLIDSQAREPEPELRSLSLSLFTLDCRLLVLLHATFYFIEFVVDCPVGCEKIQCVSVRRWRTLYHKDK